MFHEAHRNPSCEDSRAGPMIPGSAPQLSAVRPGDPAIHTPRDGGGHRESCDAASIARILQEKVREPECDVARCFGVEERRRGAVGGGVGLLRERWAQWNAELLVRSTRVRECHEADPEKGSTDEVCRDRR